MGELGWEQRPKGVEAGITVELFRAHSRRQRGGVVPAATISVDWRRHSACDDWEPECLEFPLAG